MITREWFHSGWLPPAAAYALGLLLAAALLALLWRELRGNRHPLRRLLIVTRAGLAAVVTLLLAQPNLLLTTREEQPGTTLALVDDSASMFTRDAATEPRRLLELARVLHLPELAGRPAEIQRDAERLRAGAAPLRDLQAAVAAAQADLRTGLPWSDAAAAAVARAAAPLHELRAALDTLRTSGRLAAAEVRAAESAAAALGGADEPGTLLGLAGRTLEQADWVVLERRAAECATALDTLDRGLETRQAEADAAFLRDQGRQEAFAAALRDAHRYTLARRAIAAAPELRGAAALNLARRTPAALEAAEAASQTDLVEPLRDALDERPLELINAVCLFSDGAQNRTYDVERLSVFAKRGVPLVVVGTGDLHAGDPLAITDFDCPLLATLRAPVTTDLDLRLGLPAGTRVDVRYDVEYGATAPNEAPTNDSRVVRRTAAGTPLAGEALPHATTAVLGGPGPWHQRVRLRLARPGYHTLKVTARAGGAEAAQSVPVYVAPERPAVLVVAERPDLLTAALLAQRRHGIGVYSVFTYGREANARRGESRQLLPGTARDWARYDLIVLCGPPFPGFTRDDALALAAAVREGRTLLLAADAGAGYWRALAGEFGWPSPPTAAPPPAPAGIAPQDDATHWPLARLSGDRIRNRNLWQEFAAPAEWRPAPEQDAVLFRHPQTDTPAVSLGVHGAGRVVYAGLAGWPRMNEWNPALFDRLVSRLVMDLLIPLLPGEPSQPALDVYPGVGEPGARAFLLARAPAATTPTLDVRVTSAGGEAATVTLARRGDGYVGAHVFGDEGRYTLAAAGVERTYAVQRAPSSETRDVSLREDFLRELAEAAGGVYAPLERLPEALSAVPPRTRESVSTRTVRTLDYRTSLLLLFLACAAADFALRKQIGLVM